MSNYTEHFHLRDQPFALTPDTDFYCELPSHQDTLNTLLFSLRNGDGFIKVIGEVGVGKTLLCRKLLGMLNSQEYVTAYIPNPALTPMGIKKAIAAELDVTFDADIDEHALLNLCYEKLLAYSEQGKKVILIIDEGQALSDESLETIRLLTNLETEKMKLLQVVIFAQPELDQRLKQPHLRQLLNRIIFNCYIKPMHEQDIENYVIRRLVSAGHATGKLFNAKAIKKLYQYSAGIPRTLNILCQKTMLLAYGHGLHQIDKKAVDEMIKCEARDNALLMSRRFNLLNFFLLLIIVLLVGAVSFITYLLIHGQVAI